MANRRIKVVFFDIGNVLLRFEPSRVAARIAWAVGQHPIQIAKLLWQGLTDPVERGDISPEELFRMFREELGFEGSFGSFRRLWCEHFTLDRRAAAVLRQVGRRSRVYLLSNTNELHYEFISSRYNFVRHVNGAVLSYKLGLRKPEPGIYRAALRRANVRAGEAVFIDDMEENVEAAIRLGMRAILYTGADKLRSDLTALGVLGPSELV